jgi:hypothetical protein
MPSTRRLFRAAGLISWSASALWGARTARRDQKYELKRHEPGLKFGNPVFGGIEAEPGVFEVEDPVSSAWLPISPDFCD